MKKTAKTCQQRCNSRKTRAERHQDINNGKMAAARQHQKDIRRRITAESWQQKGWQQKLAAAERQQQKGNSRKISAGSRGAGECQAKDKRDDNDDDDDDDDDDDSHMARGIGYKPRTYLQRLLQQYGKRGTPIVLVRSHAHFPVSRKHHAGRISPI